MKVCVLRIEGTNCEEESYYAFKRLGATTEIVHLNEFLRRNKRLSDYHILMLPGGFSGGDYIRAGVIFAARLKSTLGKDLERFIEEGKPVLGICNGFQILVEAGILPGFGGIMTEEPEAALTTNDSDRFECRPTWLKKEKTTKCIFTRDIKDKQVLMIPSAHAEGKFVLPKNKEKALLESLKANGQVVFRYVTPEGKENPGYPYNPNGSIYDIAGICNKEGNVFGMMPHPERVFFRFTHNDWTRDEEKEKVTEKEGDGRVIFKSALRYVAEHF
ncbi:MAG TPA: phosphoribosylformylglycinamidine synthase subunit PurQ [Thermoplasmata archaeon]|nr:phosphoribosylformylglycinamidine synthase subunit PurQ [Thermoplasmata archaeon]